jgi:hypothetical protein
MPVPNLERPPAIDLRQQQDSEVGAAAQEKGGVAPRVAPRQQKLCNSALADRRSVCLILALQSLLHNPNAHKRRCAERINQKPPRRWGVTAFVCSAVQRPRLQSYITYSQLFAVQTCSPQAGRSLSGFVRPALSDSQRKPPYPFSVARRWLPIPALCDVL